MKVPRRWASPTTKVRARWWRTWSRTDTAASPSLPAPKTTSTHTERRCGYRDALAQLLPDAPEWVLPGAFDEASGHQRRARTPCVAESAGRGVRSQRHDGAGLPVRLHPGRACGFRTTSRSPASTTSRLPVRASGPHHHARGHFGTRCRRGTDAAGAPGRDRAAPFAAIDAATGRAPVDHPHVIGDDERCAGKRSSPRGCKPSSRRLMRRSTTSPAPDTNWWSGCRRMTSGGRRHGPPRLRTERMHSSTRLRGSAWSPWGCRPEAFSGPLEPCFAGRATGVRIRVPAPGVKARGPAILA